MQIREYQKPATLDEAYALLVKGKTNRILGGCTFLKRTNVKIGTAIDLSACGLDYIRETEEAVMIGDRYTDIDGAHACNLDAIGCRWGYAPAGEMEEHGAYEIIEKPEQIEEAVNRYFQTH